MNFIKLIEKNLDKFLPYEKSEPKKLHKAMRYSAFSGGKRIRPVILMEAALACGAGLKRSVAAACAVAWKPGSTRSSRFTPTSTSKPPFAGPLRKFVKISMRSIVLISLCRYSALIPFSFKYSDRRSQEIRSCRYYAFSKFS